MLFCVKRRQKRGYAAAHESGRPGGPRGRRGPGPLLVHVRGVRERHVLPDALDVHVFGVVRLGDRRAHGLVRQRLIGLGRALRDELPAADRQLDHVRPGCKLLQRHRLVGRHLRARVLGVGAVHNVAEDVGCGRLAHKPGLVSCIQRAERVSHVANGVDVGEEAQLLDLVVAVDVRVLLDAVRLVVHEAVAVLARRHGVERLLRGVVVVGDHHLQRAQHTHEPRLVVDAARRELGHDGRVGLLPGAQEQQVAVQLQAERRADVVAHRRRLLALGHRRLDDGRLRFAGRRRHLVRRRALLLKVLHVAAHGAALGEREAVAQHDVHAELLELCQGVLVDALVKVGQQLLPRVDERHLLLRVERLDVGRELHAERTAADEDDVVALLDALVRLAHPLHALLLAERVVAQRVRHVRAECVDQVRVGDVDRVDGPQPVLGLLLRLVVVVLAHGDMLIGHAHHLAAHNQVRLRVLIGVRGLGGAVGVRAVHGGLLARGIVVQAQLLVHHVLHVHDLVLPRRGRLLGRLQRVAVLEDRAFDPGRVQRSVARLVVVLGAMQVRRRDNGRVGRLARLRLGEDGGVRHKRLVLVPRVHGEAGEHVEVVKVAVALHQNHAVGRRELLGEHHGRMHTAITPTQHNHIFCVNVVLTESIKQND